MSQEAKHFSNSTLQDTEYHISLWNKVLLDLKLCYGEKSYKNWFDKIGFYELSSYGSIILSAPTNFIKDWIKSNYLSKIISLYSAHDSNVEYVEIITAPGILANQKTVSSQSLVAPEKKSEGSKLDLDTTFSDKKKEIFSALDPRFTFKNFVVGTSNELAYTAAFSVAETKTAILGSNPLFLYGGVGLGKTHLMHAIALHALSINKNKKILYMSAEKFMYLFIKAIRTKDVMSFKEYFRSVDILMIDDIQFICGKNSTQEEFFHTFNAIIDNNSQIVISCDRSPSDLDNIEDRIKSRLGWGLVADVHETTYELRLGILQSKVEQLKINISDKILEFLAKKITSNVRELEGALNKVIAHSNLMQRELSLDVTKEILKDLLRSNEKIITIDQIKDRVSERFNVKKTDMSSNKRSKNLVRPRQIAMYLSKKLTTKSLSDICDQFGKKDHTTMIHTTKRIEALLKTDPELKDDVSELIKILKK